MTIKFSNISSLTLRGCPAANLAVNVDYYPDLSVECTGLHGLEKCWLSFMTVDKSSQALYYNKEMKVTST